MKQLRAQQWGGTVLGLIIGTVIGLGIALAVAVYVTKVPVPFLTKGPSRTIDQDAAEQRRNKDWDPNAPLYGKNPARAAVPAAPVTGEAPDYKGVPPAVAGIPTPAVAAERGAVANPPAVAAPSADPLGDLAKSRATASSSTVDPFAYFVQVGAYRTTNDAEAQRARLSLAGVEARVSEREQSGRTVYRVRAGPFDKREDAELTKQKLEALGMEAALVRVQR